jgi:transposase
MRPDIVAVGVDVAKATLSVHARNQDGTSTALGIGNTETDINRLIAEHLAGYRGKVVMESTGHYHWLIALLLKEAGADVRVINPILGKKYTSASIRQVKTDPADARMLSEMCLKEEKLPPTFALNAETMLLRKKLGFIASLSTELAALNAMVTSLREAHATLGGKLSDAEDGVLKTVRDLEKNIRRLEREVEKEAAQADGADRKLEVLTSIPGVSAFTAATALHWFSLAAGATKKSWIAYAGLDVSVRESGTWHGRCRLTKRGNNFLRRRLYSAAWGAFMHDADFKSAYQTLRKDGRAHVEALVILARKIVRIMFYVLTNDAVYDATKAFATAP